MKIPDRITLRLSDDDVRAIVALREHFGIESSNVSKIVKKALRQYATALNLERRGEIQMVGYAQKGVGLKSLS
jgi:hypothetical protein